jgi:hypothetical protein
MSNKIEKPWAVYGTFAGKYMGKVVREGEIIDIRSSDKDQNPDLWPNFYVKQFYTSSEAIEYFLLHSGQENNKEKIVRDFLLRFPCEKVNLEKLLTK